MLVDHDLSGLIVGLTLATRPEDVYRALLEATAFGTRIIVETFDEAGVPVHRVVVAGGLQKYALLMQIYADVLDLPLSIDRLRPGPGARLGDPRGCRRRGISRRARPPPAMGRVERAIYLPDPARAPAYDVLYADYRALHDHFGRGGDDVMHRLKAAPA